MSNSNGIITAPIDIKGDVAYVLGRTTVGDVGLLCSDKDAGGNLVGAVNMWSAHKPVRSSKVSPLAESEFRALNYGLYANTSIVLTVGYQDPYFEYRRPRGGSQPVQEAYRLMDFENYNHNAQVPMLSTSIPVNSNTGAIHIVLSTIVNSSANVEIPLDDLNNFSAQSYVGFALWDVTKKFGYIIITDVQLSDLLRNSIPSASYHDFWYDIIDLPFYDGDVVEFFWCLYPSTFPPDQGGNLPAIEIDAGIASTLALMAVDSAHGHTTYSIVKFNLNEDIGFTNTQTVVSGAWNAGQSEWTLNSFATRLQCQYNWPRATESIPVRFKMLDGAGAQIFYVDSVLAPGNASQWYDLSLSNGSKTYTLSQLVEDNYNIRLELTIELQSSHDTRVTLANITYNVQTGQISYTV